MEIVQIYPRGSLEYADQFILSILFDKEELLSMGMQEGQAELSDLYIEEDEFNKLYKLWKDPDYLDDFFENYKEFFEDDYWDDITKARFISDVTSSAPFIFREIRTLFDEGKLDEIFEPLGREDKAREPFMSIRVKIQVWPNKSSCCF